MAGATDICKWDETLHIACLPLRYVPHPFDAKHINIHKWVPSARHFETLYVYKRMGNVAMGRELEYKLHPADVVAYI
jgi:hypothetical protein